MDRGVKCNTGSA